MSIALYATQHSAAHSLFAPGCMNPAVMCTKSPIRANLDRPSRRPQSSGLRVMVSRVIPAALYVLCGSVSDMYVYITSQLTHRMSVLVHT